MIARNAHFQSCCLLLLMGLAGSVVCALPAHADDADPFQMDSGHWMSFDRYDDNVKRNRPVGNEVLMSPPKVDAPEPAAAPASDNQNQISPEAADKTTKDNMSVVATPSRPLDLPLLPGVNKGFSLQVNSTANMTEATTPAQIVNKDDGTTELHLRDINWQDAAEIARQRADEANGLNLDAERIPLDVRMTYLPNPKIAPFFAEKKKKGPRLVTIPTPKVASTAPQPSDAAALDLFKKRRLEAIQSDRQTLEALQSAIKELGLQEQLNFMVGGQNQQMDFPPASQSYDVPPSTTMR